jgi:preprotein translocase subunit YajC
MAQLQQFLPILLIIGVFYFLIIRPQQKRASAQRDMLAAIKSGDEIVTVGGIYAVIIEVGERVRVRVADGSELELAKQAIAQVVPPKDAAAQDDEEDGDETAQAELDEDAGPDGGSDSPES